jgi:3D (Asp-Asp-Asp) domain-containing protein
MNEALTLNTRTQTKMMNNHSRTGRVVAGPMTLWMCALAVVITSAIWTKERGSLPALAGIESVSTPINNQDEITESIPMIELTPALSTPSQQADTKEEPTESIDSSIRWFDGKKIRPARTIYMTVTGYSPDERSCGKFADNKTATMYSVWTNGMNLVAADPKVLPYWSMVSIPGYANDDIVPVLDCGGAIKGNRIDLLYPTHELARVWGVRQMPVTVWEFVEED